MAGNIERFRKRLGDESRLVIPALLQCDYGRLAEEVSSVVQGGAEAVHWDVMDGEFVPNFTYGPPVIKSVRSRFDVVFDAHLMMAKPEKYLDGFIDAGCDIITLHLEAVPEPTSLLRKIRHHGRIAGLAVNPSTPIDLAPPLREEFDLLLIMSVAPGFGSQPFDSRALGKIEAARRFVRPGTLIEVDGGINSKTIASVAKAGADLLVAGSAILGSFDRGAAIRELSRIAVSAPGGQA